MATRFRYLFSCAIIMGMLNGCAPTNTDVLDIAIQQAGANAPEIRKVLTHYDAARNDAAEYLVNAMIGRYGKQLFDTDLN